MVNSSGTQVEDKVYLLEINFYTGANATGTVYPTAAVDSTGSGGVLRLLMVINIVLHTLTGKHSTTALVLDGGRLVLIT